MSEINMNDFLSRLGKETVTRINKERKAYSRPTQRVEESAEQEEPKPQKKKVVEQPPQDPKPRKKKPEPMEEEQKTLHEEEVDQAMKFGSIMINTIKKSFETEAGRRMAYEAVRTAVNMILGEQQSYAPRQSYSAPKVPQQQSMSEAEYDSIPVVQQDPQPVYENQGGPGGYSRDMGIRSAGDEVDLSNVSSKDIADFKSLAGME